MVGFFHSMGESTGMSVSLFHTSKDSKPQPNSEEFTIRLELNSLVGYGMLVMMKMILHFH